MALEGILDKLKEERDMLSKELGRITKMIRAAGKGAQAAMREYKRRGRKRNFKAVAKTNASKRKPMSAAGRKKIAAAQKARWAKAKAEKKAA